MKVVDSLSKNIDVLVQEIIVDFAGAEGAHAAMHHLLKNWKIRYVVPEIALTRMALCTWPDPPTNLAYQDAKVSGLDSQDDVQVSEVKVQDDVQVSEVKVPEVKTDTDDVPQAQEEVSEEYVRNQVRYRKITSGLRMMYCHNIGHKICLESDNPDEHHMFEYIDFAELNSTLHADEDDDTCKRQYKEREGEDDLAARAGAYLKNENV